MYRIFKQKRRTEYRKNLKQKNKQYGDVIRKMEDIFHSKRIVDEMEHKIYNKKAIKRKI